MPDVGACQESILSNAGGWVDCEGRKARLPNWLELLETHSRSLLIDKRPRAPIIQIIPTLENISTKNYLGLFGAPGAGGFGAHGMSRSPRDLIRGRWHRIGLRITSHTQSRSTWRPSSQDPS